MRFFFCHKSLIDSAPSIGHFVHERFTEPLIWLLAKMQMPPPPMGMSSVRMTDIREPSENDILMGRGGGTNNHVGNRNYRDIIQRHKAQYSQSAKHEKQGFSRSIVDMIRNLNPPGRFLTKDKKTGYYYDIGDKAAVEKTSQCLREGQPKLKQAMGLAAEDAGSRSASPRGASSRRTRSRRQQQQQQQQQLQQRGGAGPRLGDSLNQGGAMGGLDGEERDIFDLPSAEVSQVYDQRDFLNSYPPTRSSSFSLDALRGASFSEYPGVSLASTSTEMDPPGASQGAQQGAAHLSRPLFVAQTSIGPINIPPPLPDGSAATNYNAVFAKEGSSKGVKSFRGYKRQASLSLTDVADDPRASSSSFDFNLSQINSDPYSPQNNAHLAALGKGVFNDAMGMVDSTSVSNSNSNSNGHATDVGDDDEDSIDDQGEIERQHQLQRENDRGHERSSNQRGVRFAQRERESRDVSESFRRLEVGMSSQLGWNDTT